MTDAADSQSLSRRGFLRSLIGAPDREVADPDRPADSQVTYDGPVVTPAACFFTQTYRRTGGPPVVDLGTWTLTITGLVEKPLVLTYADIRALPAMGEMRTLVCLGNAPGGDQIGNAVWRGFDLDVVLSQVGVQAGAMRVRFDSHDGYSTSVPLDRVMGRGALMAYGMNGAVLPPEHGFPLRALVPGLYGSKSPKWVSRITLINHDHLGFWEGPPHHWSDAATIKTQAHIARPLPYSEVAVGEPVALQGVAFAGARRITAVALSIDGGDWMPVTLRPPDSPHAWTQWYTLWTPEVPGECRLSVRASDDAGFTQSRLAGLSDAYPDGSDAIHSIILRVV